MSRECVDSHVAILRPGGKFKFENDSDHGPPFEGVYRVVELPAQLEFDALGAIGTVRLESEGSKTHMTGAARRTDLRPRCEHAPRRPTSAGTLACPRPKRTASQAVARALSMETPNCRRC